MKKQLLITSGTMVAILGAIGLFQPAASTGPAIAHVEIGTALPPMVRTQLVESAPDKLSRPFFGRVRARETVDLALQVGGTLERLIPEEGMAVGRGTVIAQLRLDSFERAVARAELQLDMATRDAARAHELAERAAAPTSRAEDAETARALAEVALRDARAALNDATLTAPFDGLVAARMVAEHSSIAPGQPVLRLHDMSQLRVEISVPERLLARTGQLETLRFAADLPQGTIPLQPVSFQPETARVGQSFRVTLALPDGAGAGLLPGASLTVTAAIPAPQRSISVPSEAIFAANDRSASVFVLAGTEEMLHVRQMPVTVVAPSGSGLEVQGLPIGAEIVTAGAHRLREGQHVRRFSPLSFVER
ncbi:MAG: efflux RND transporter periplasmic adaptor subunit [Roseinatronobacter sp.]|nr:efflux RND transporter periplasmic adaptor subunit [Roseinatronobacter sp.]